MAQAGPSPPSAPSSPPAGGRSRRAPGTRNGVSACNGGSGVADSGGRVVGLHMIGPRVTELVAEAQLIVNWEAYPAEVAALLHPHPTLSEAVGETMLHLAGKQLHGA